MIGKLKWIPVSKQPVPIEKPIMATDGKVICYCIVNVRPEYYTTIVPASISLISIGSEDAEYMAEAFCAFDFENITHWIDMSGLELPK